MTVYDCFRILELPRNAGIDDLKFAYRDKAKKYHPDRKGGDSRQFNRLHEAYSFLLDYGPFKRGYSREQVNQQQNQNRKAYAEREAFRKSEEERKKREALREKLRKAAEEKAARERKERLKRETDRKARMKAAAAERERIARKKSASNKSPMHRAHIAGEILSGKNSDREKLKAIDTLIALKRKSAYPYLKNGLYCGSEKVIIASIIAVGKLQIIQAGPELHSLICSGSIGIRKAVLVALESFRNLSPYKGILEMGLSDKNPEIRRKAKELRNRLNG